MKYIFYIKNLLQNIWNEKNVSCERLIGGLWYHMLCKSEKLIHGESGEGQSQEMMRRGIRRCLADKASIPISNGRPSNNWSALKTNF